jgi:hypothetical protein
MLQRTTPTQPTPVPGRPVRVLIEDPALIVDDLETPAAAIDVTVCGGPRDEREVCPLVMDGSCPLGPCDIVVSALEGSWAPSVRAAWAETSTPMVDARDLAATDPTERLHHHIGAAIQRLCAPYGTGVH